LVPLTAELSSVILGIVIIKCQLFVHVDCWFVTFEKVGYGTTYEHKMLWFAAQITFRDKHMIEEAYGKAAVKKIKLYEWHKHFCSSHAGGTDDPLCG
jgi:hypothetical protein